MSILRIIIKGFIITTLIFIAFPTYGKSKKKKMIKDEVSGAIIQKVLNNDLPKALCKKNSRMLKCFKISESNCKKVVRKNMGRCFKKNKIAKKMRTIAAVQYSENFGICVKKYNDKALSKKRKLNPKKYGVCK